MRLITGMWQEHGCTGCLIDFDICEESIASIGDRVPCSGCYGYHVAGEDPGPTETLVSYSDGTLEVRELPKDASEKAAWLSEPRDRK